MPRTKKTTEEVNEVEAVETAPEAVQVEPEEVNETPVAVTANGKFQAIRVKGGFQIYGPTGQIISSVIENEAKAGDMVIRFNLGR